MPPAEDLTFRNIDEPNLRAGFSRWVDRLDESKAECVPARNLYSGDHWGIVNSLEGVTAASQIDAAVWICSAGYGLIGIDSNIKPYSATFSFGHPDTICKWNPLNSRQDDLALWWQLHEKWGGPDQSLPRSITQVAAADPDTPLLVVASKNYLGAIANDVMRAAQALREVDLLSVISTGTNIIPGLDGNLLSSTAALSSSVGGNLRTLNIRLARAILEESTGEELRASRLNSKFKRWIEESPPLPTYERSAMTDDGISLYIFEALTDNQKTSWSMLLRRLRDSGRACGQERFSRLYDSMKLQSVVDK